MFWFYKPVWWVEYILLLYCLLTVEHFQLYLKLQNQIYPHRNVACVWKKEFVLSKIGHPFWKGSWFGTKTEEKNLLCIPGLQSDWVHGYNKPLHTSIVWNSSNQLNPGVFFIFFSIARRQIKFSFALFIHANIGVYSVLIILAGCWCPCMVLHHHFV